MRTAIEIAAAHGFAEAQMQDDSAHAMVTLVVVSPSPIGEDALDTLRADLEADGHDVLYHGATEDYLEAQFGIAVPVDTTMPS